MALLPRDMPLTRFDSRYHDLIVQGTTNRVEIKLNTPREAKRLRNLLTTYRARFRDHWKRQNDDRWEVLYSAIIGLSPDGYSVVIRPSVQEADHLLQNISVDEVGVSPETSSSSLSSDPLAEFDVSEEKK